MKRRRTKKRPAVPRTVASVSGFREVFGGDPLATLRVMADVLGRSVVRCEGCGEVQVNTAASDLAEDDERLAAPCRFCESVTAAYA